MGQILSSSTVQASPCLPPLSGRLLSSCGIGSTLVAVGFHSICGGGSAPLYLSFADPSLVVSGGSSLVVVVGLLSSCGRVLSSNCGRGGYCLVVM